MMGYNEKDILAMQLAIEKARDFVLAYPSTLMDKSWLTDLNEAITFFDGLIEEGRV